MALDPYALTTLAKVKTALGITDSSQDTALEDLINASTAMIENELHRKFKARDYTEFYDGTDDKAITLNSYPVNSVANFYLDPALVYGPESQLIENVNFVVHKEEGALELLGGSEGGYGSLGTGAKALKVVYNAGYATIPYDLDRACVLLTVYHYDNARQLGVKSISIGSFSQSFGDMGVMPPAVMGMLKPYSRLYAGL